MNISNNPIKSSHIIADVYINGIFPDIEELLDISIKETKELTVIKKFKHNFNPIGLSLIYILAESHISVHTWPEYNYMSIDLYTCGKTTPENTLDNLLSKLDIHNLNTQTIQRGV